MARSKLKLLWGKVRRYYLSHFRKGYVRRQIEEKRRGECSRCGECCKLGMVCPWLTDGNVCEKYEDRPLQCRNFPIDERDLEDMPECTFWFADEED
jgi:Fe-S-cluster containining protein